MSNQFVFFYHNNCWWGFKPDKSLSSTIAFKTSICSIEPSSIQWSVQSYFCCDNHNIKDSHTDFLLLYCSELTLCGLCSLVHFICGKVKANTLSAPPLRQDNLHWHATDMHSEDPSMYNCFKLMQSIRFWKLGLKPLRQKIPKIWNLLSYEHSQLIY